MTVTGRDIEERCVKQHHSGEHDQRDRFHFAQVSAPYISREEHRRGDRKKKRNPASLAVVPARGEHNSEAAAEQRNCRTKRSLHQRAI